MPGAITVSITSPANLSAGLTGTLGLTASAQADMGVASVEFQIDGEAVGAPITTAPYASSLDTGGYAPGQHIVRARAHDTAGNTTDWAAATVSFGGSQRIAAIFTKQEDWVPGLANATAFAQAPDGRLFVCEQGGTLRIVKNGVLLPTPFHSFAAIDSSGERGLLGVALHPAFTSNGLVYVYRTTTTGGTHNRVSRLVANGDVSTGSETVLADLPALSSATNHNGGGMHFGADGKLYVGVGDNASSGNSQNLATPLGKMLRLNDDGSIPADNPFVATQSGLAQAVWAYGLRNPFTFAFQPGTGRLHINDVGENTWEEVDLGAAGANYGWPNSEGPDNVTAGITGPLFTYKHTAATPPGSGPGGFFVGMAIVGGTFYPASGGSFPDAYAGNYFFADFVDGFIGRLDPANGYAAYAFAQLSGNPVDMLAGADGSIYVLTRSAITRISHP
jgi:glucose/arabinose dehydrogenase